jgi:hypothetical protein
VTRPRGSKSLEKSGPPYRHVPEIPEPKTRERARYRVVVINQTGRSRQIELTPSRLRVCLAGLLAVVALIVVSTLSVKALFMKSTPSTGREEALGKKVRVLEEEIRKKELALAVQEKHLKQENGLSSAPASQMPQRVGLSEERSAQQGASRTSESVPLTSTRSPLPTEQPSEPPSGEGEQKTVQPAALAPESSDLQNTPTSDETRSGGADESSPKSSRVPVTNFNAKDVTAVPDGPTSGLLRFWLVKDRPDVKFAGYLFVYVEMTDDQGEAKLYVYPQEARRGEGDLPKDYREGKSIAFKYNSKVELPYSDIRPGATLATVSILLYGENGKIVFQRGFERSDLKVERRKKATDGAGTRSVTKRRAL